MLQKNSGESVLRGRDHDRVRDQGQHGTAQVQHPLLCGRLRAGRVLGRRRGQNLCRVRGLR